MCGCGAEVPRTPSKKADANLERAFVENALIFVVPKIGGPRPCLKKSRHRVYLVGGTAGLIATGAPEATPPSTLRLDRASQPVPRPGGRG